MSLQTWPREPCINDGTLHAWEKLGLDISDAGTLVRVRRCVWCPVEQEQDYAPGRHPWRTRTLTGRRNTT